MMYLMSWWKNLDFLQTELSCKRHNGKWKEHKYEQNELHEKAVEDIQEELEKYLQGLVINDYITRQEQIEVIDNFNNWAKDAQYCDVYYYDEEKYIMKEPTEE